MKKANQPLLIALIVVLAASACVVALPVPASTPIPSPAFEQTNGQQPIKLTLPANPTRLQPSPSASITTTPFSSITPLPSPTATGTETPIGFFASDTPIPPTIEISATPEKPDPQEGATDDWGSATRCTLKSKTPGNWTELQPKQQLKATWTLQNSGSKTWQADQILLVFLDGVSLSSQKKETLKRDVKIGQTTTAAITIVTPKIPGNYRSVWGLKLLTGHLFCTFTIKITVK